MIKMASTSTEAEARVKYDQEEVTGLKDEDLICVQLLENVLTEEYPAIIPEAKEYLNSAEAAEVPIYFLVAAVVFFPIVQFITPFKFPSFHLIDYISHYRYHISFYEIPLFLGLVRMSFYLYTYTVLVLFPSSSKKDIIWIRRELRFLEAILKEAKDVLAMSAQIKEILKSGLRHIDNDCDSHSSRSNQSGEVTLAPPVGVDAEWVTDTEDLVLLGKNIVSKQMSRERSISKMLIAIFKDPKQLEEVIVETTNVRKEMESTLLKMKQRYETGLGVILQDSRSKIRNLLDKPIWEYNENRSEDFKQKLTLSAALTFRNLEKSQSVFASFNSNIGEQIHLINLQFLFLKIFLKEVESLPTETIIEEAWLEEMEEFIGLVQCTSEKFIQIANRGWWRKTLSIWWPWGKLKTDIKRVSTGFALLFEIKDRYGIRFIRRKSFNQYQSTAEDNVISQAMHQIRYYLQRVKESSYFEIYNGILSLTNQLEESNKLLLIATVARGRNNVFIKEWSGNLRNVAQSTSHFIEVCIRDLPQLNKIHLMYQQDPTNETEEQSANESKTDDQEGDESEKQMRTATAPRKRSVKLALFKSKAEKKLLREIKTLKSIVNVLNGSMRAFHIELSQESNIVLGLEEDAHEVTLKLSTNNNNTDQHCSILSIVGMRGTGKTTLAKQIFNHRHVLQHFDFRAWVSVPPLFNDNWYNVVGMQILQPYSEVPQGVESSKENWIHKLTDSLKDKRSLIVMDNVSSAETWIALKEMFQEITTGRIKLLVTTRDKKGACAAGSTVHQLGLRSMEDGWRLFNQTLPISSKEEKRGMKILRKCGGLPLHIIRLAISVLGKDLASIRFEDIIKNDTAFLEAFRLAKENMHLVQCLSYLLLFPGNFEIPARRLLTLWVAEGLAKRHESQTPEEVSEKYLKELIDFNMIQVTKRKLSGKVKTCCLPTALVNQLRSEANVNSHNNRLADHLDSGQPSFEHIHGDILTNGMNFQSYKGLQSFLSFDNREGYRPGEEVGGFLCKCIEHRCFRELLVLDLEGVFRPALPEYIGKLSNLRYLGLRRTYLQRIPPSIGELSNLQTLDVKHTYVRTVPCSIWKLHRLRHLYLNQIYRSKLTSNLGGNALKDLQTLWGIFIDEDSPLLDFLDKLTNLRKLGISFHLSDSNQEKIAKRIAKLKQLQSLRLRSIGEKGEPCNLHLNALPCLEGLSSLELFGTLKVSSIVNKFPETLTDLILSASHLSDDPMPKLGKLPCLKSLCFYYKSLTRETITCSSGDFKELLVLKIWKLDELLELEVNEGALPKLRELEFRSCKNMGVPYGLKHLNSLLKLKLTNMPERFDTDIEQLWDETSHSPSIVIDKWLEADLP